VFFPKAWQIDAAPAAPIILLPNDAGESAGIKRKKNNKRHNTLKQTKNLHQLAAKQKKSFCNPLSSQLHNTTQKYTPHTLCCCMLTSEVK
jgi:hypothetical protein